MAAEYTPKQHSATKPETKPHQESIMEKTVNPQATPAQIKRAVDYWMHVVGDFGLQPNEGLCTLVENGTVWLKNVNGHIGFVTRTGKCFNRIGGEPLGEATTSIDMLINALRAIVIETTDYTPTLPESADSYLPGSFIEAAQTALASYGAAVTPVTLGRD